MSVQLHARSYFSLLSSPISMEDYILKSKALGYDSVALTDYKTMHGAYAFNKYCRKHGVKPLFGLEFPVSIDDESFDFLVLAKNDEGFKSMMKLSSTLNSSKNKVTLDRLEQGLDDCILIVYGEGGYLEPLFQKQSELEKVLHDLKGRFNDFYVAISYNDAEFFRIKNNDLKKTCLSLNINTVALSKIYYLESTDQPLYKVLQGIKDNKSYHDKTLVVPNGRHLRTMEEMRTLYDEDDLRATDEIAQRCSVSMQLEKTSLPKFKTPQNASGKDYLIRLCHAGLNKRLDNQLTTVYQKRLKDELDVILNMHFEDYFLIVYDFVRFAKMKGIYVGPGRGSAAGSLVAYCLGITHVDPIKYDLLFERFLNPERISMPDIDLDLPDDRRQEVIDYVLETYGNQHFAHIVTFNTLAARQVMKDVSRVMDIPMSKADQLSKSIPNMLKMTLKKAYEEHLPFRQLIDSEKRFREVFDIALKLEGMPRHSSLHAAGIVISQLPLTDVVPIMEIDHGLSVTQYTMDCLEDLGLIKMDLLGLRNLTIIDEITQVIKKEATFDIYRIPLDDAKTFKLVSEANTQGVFQLESSGMKKLLRDMKPESFEDIAATIALFRPGPMQNIPLFLKNRAHKDTIDYLHPDLKPILMNTYGVIVYQEQIMKIAQVMAGFSLGKADILRKAMSKKNKDELMKLSEDFINGCIINGYTQVLAKALYELVLRFADYGFNKSHSIAYGLIAYQLAYLKANYSLIFYQALLNSVKGAETKTSEYIYEAKQAIKLLAVDINYSQTHYTIEDNGIRLPLSIVKNVGQVAIKNIIQDRLAKGLYKDYYDFVVRAMAIKLSRKMIESLIDAGALDCFKQGRLSMLESLHEAINYADLVRIENEDAILIDLKLVSKPIMIIAKDDRLVRSYKEKEALGFYFSSSVLAELKKQHQIQTEPMVILKQKFGYVSGFATINRVKQHRTKKGSLMAFISVSDETGELDVVAMPDHFQRYSALLVKGQHILFEGNIEKEGSCLLKKMSIITQKEENHG